MPGDVTLFRGDNVGPDAARALEQWEADEGHAIAPAHRPSPSVAVRLALVHEFRHRSKVFISTEAGAKGLNLQFCDTVINYDLPWNPQRIEQRIGRVHRYGQKRGVTVISFLAAGNVAQRLTLEILAPEARPLRQGPRRLRRMCFTSRRTPRRNRSSRAWAWISKRSFVSSTDAPAPSMT